MSLKQSAFEELQRSPIATISGAVAAALAALGLGLAWLQYSAMPSQVSPQVASAVNWTTPGGIALGNLLLIVAYFIAVMTAVSVALRLVARKHDIAAFFASVPTVALANFSAILVIYLAPPRAVSAQLFQQAHDLVFYASGAIVIVFCGAPMLTNLFESTSRKKATSDSGEEHSESGGSILAIALMLLALWGWLVFAGQSRLTKTLLPEITHPAERREAKSGA